MSDDEPIRASVYVEYKIRSKLSPEDHVKRKCDCVSPTGEGDKLTILLTGITQENKKIVA